MRQRKSSSEFRRIISFGIALVAGFILTGSGLWKWSLRDGLGPDSNASSGIEAWGRFSADFWPIAALCSALFAVAFFILPRTKRA